MRLVAVARHIRDAADDVEGHAPQPAGKRHSEALHVFGDCAGKGLQSEPHVVGICRRGADGQEKIGLFAAGSVAGAIRALRASGTKIPIEVEVERLEQIEEAIAAGADMLLLDNFTPAMMREAVALAAGRLKLEASGGFELADLPAVGATGVDFVSVGALTKHVRAIDFSMRIVTG